ncbi:MAG TPA: DUF5693 family protein, partial [Fimbriimonadaceae bacterium]|nr:DUF5693 family protein [Fimbriimonadaceae bacterium]
ATVWIDASASDLARIQAAVTRRFPSSQPRLASPAGSSVGSLSVTGVSPAILRRLSLGLNPSEAAAAREAGLSIIGRFANTAGATPEWLESVLDQAQAAGVRYFLPLGEQVLGRRENLAVVAEGLRRRGIHYAAPEFAKIGGDANVIAMHPENVVQLHAAQAAELDRLPLEDAVERYAKAARERNVRMLLLRPLSLSAPLPLDEFGEFVSEVRKSIVADGATIRDPHPFEEPAVPRPLFLLIALAAVPVLVWTGTVFVRDPRLRLLGASLVLLLAFASWTGSGRQYMALLIAIGFPTAAFLILDMRGGRRWPLEFLIVSLVSLSGGLAVAGLLNELKFLVRADQFAGVKVAHFLPLALIGLYFFARFSSPRDTLAGPVRWGQAALAFALLVAFALMATRTGNDNPAAVSGLELKIRSILDALLFVRPRTKEFLIGHPLLIVGIAWLIMVKARGSLESPGAQQAAGWASLALMAGAIGQTSIVNTLCHLHTPVALSLARIAVGLLAGGILGGLLSLLLVRATGKDSSNQVAKEGL